MAIYELRTYTVTVGKMSDVVALYKTEGWPALSKHPQKLCGYFTGDIGAVNQLVHLWKFDDDADRRNELRLKNFHFFDAPCAMFMFMDGTLGPWSTLDMGIFLQGLTLSAHGAGLGCCLQASLAGYPDAIREFLGIPNTKKMIVGMSMGYPDPDAPLNAYHSTRMEIDEFVKWY